MLFHEIRFPTNIAKGATGGPERRTDIITLSSGYEERNSRWADSRRSYNAGYGLRGIDDMNAVLTFFEERRAQLYGFRWKDFADFRSGPPSVAPSATDQVIAAGDGTTARFQLIKTYGGQFAPYARPIKKPVQGTLLLAVSGAAQAEGAAFTVDYTTGLVTFASGSVPAAGMRITAGYEFDVPVRFNTDQIEINIQNFMAGSIPHIPIVEVKL